MTFEVLILGNSGAVQAHGRHQSSQLLKIDNYRFLIDCGEGTQDRLKARNVNTNKIKHIFISHLHGDHFLGLFGLISTLSLMGREKSLTVFGPRGIKEIIQIQLKYSNSWLNFPLNIIELKTGKHCIFEDNRIEIYNFPLDHGIECHGFLFKEKQRPNRVQKEKISVTLDFGQIRALKQGEDVTLPNGTVLKNKDYTIPSPDAVSYAYCSDTSYNEDMVDYIKKVNILYHESTFLAIDKEKALKTNHSTTQQAATIAQKAEVGKLLLGHYSARYVKEIDFENEAREIFANSWATIEGKIYGIDSN